MSEYQYYEFQAIDRPLDSDDRAALGALSSRAQITASSFINTYQWGDFKGDPAELMARWFDLHLYLANWGTHQLMIRLPKRLVDQRRLADLLRPVACASLREADGNLILDVTCVELDVGAEWDGHQGVLASLAPLRADILNGDLRLFYLLWLIAVEGEDVDPEETEPLPGIGPLTGALQAFADFFCIDPDLVAAASERPAGAVVPELPSADELRTAVASLPDADKVDWLMRVVDGEPHVGSALRLLLPKCLAPADAAPHGMLRTAGALRARMQEIAAAREREAAEKLAAEQRQRAEQEARARRAHLDELGQRGEAVWQEIESQIERRNARGYENATALLEDLRSIAEERGTTTEFGNRLRSIRERHAQKPRFVSRLEGLA